MTQLVLVRCTQCKRRYVQHGDAGCPFCAVEGRGAGGAVGAPVPKVMVGQGATAEVVRKEQPRPGTPPPPPAKAPAARPAEPVATAKTLVAMPPPAVPVAPPASTPVASKPPASAPASTAAPPQAAPAAAAPPLGTAAKGIEPGVQAPTTPSASPPTSGQAAAAPLAQAKAPDKSAITSAGLPPERPGAIVLKPEAPLRVGPITLPRRVWIPIIAVVVLVIGSYGAWVTLQSEFGHAARDVAAPDAAPAPMAEVTDEPAAEADTTPPPAPPVAPADEPAAPTAKAPTPTPAPPSVPAVAPASSASPGGRPMSASGHFREGTRLFMDGKAGSAQTHFEAAIALDQSHCGAHRALGVIYSTQRDTRRSVEAYDRYLRCSPESPDGVEIRRRIAVLRGEVAPMGEGMP